MTDLAAWRAARRVLAVRLDNLGDVVMTTPALAALAAGGRHLTLLTSTSGAAVAPLLPFVSRTIAHDAPWIKSPSPSPSSSSSSPSPPPPPSRDLALIAALRDAQLDAAVLFTVYSQSPLPAALLCHLADIPLRLAHCRENPYHLLTDWIPDPEPALLVRHEVRRQLDLVAAAGFTPPSERLSLRVPDHARARARDTLSRLGLSRTRWLLVHPGATAPSRRYPPALFAEAADRFFAATSFPIVFTGAADEQPLIAQIQSRTTAPSFSLAGALDLPTFAALVEAAPVVVSGNSAPVHIAAALGTPVVDLYALTNPQHTPWAVPNRVLSHDVPCKYCYKSTCPEGHHLCLRGVPPERVALAALELLATPRLPLSPSVKPT